MIKALSLDSRERALRSPASEGTDGVMLSKDFACTMRFTSISRFAHVISLGAIARNRAMVRPD